MLRRLLSVAAPRTVGWVQPGSGRLGEYLVQEAAELLGED